MNKNRKIRKEKGAITIYVILSVAFFAIFIIGAYILANRKLQMQYEAIKDTSDVYKSSKSDNSSAPEFLPIYNQQQLEAIGTSNNVYVYQYGKSYDYSNENNKYELKDDVSVNNTYINSYNTLKAKIDKISISNNHIIIFTDGYMYYDNGWVFTTDKISASYYGDYIDYGVDINGDGDTTNDWRVFLDDGDNVYLIAADFIPQNLVPKNGNNNSFLQENGFVSVINDYQGSADIVKNEKLSRTLSKYNKWINNNQTATTNSIKSIAYMLDTKTWTKAFTNSSNINYVDYAIGGPTVEMFCDSYNEMHDVKIGYDENNTDGYKLKIGDSAYAWDISGLDRNSLYIITKNDRISNYYWLASPTGFSSSWVIRTYYWGYLTTGPYNQNGAAFRPVVCLKSNTKLCRDGLIWKMNGQKTSGLATDVASVGNYGKYVDYGVDLNGDGDTTNDWRIFLNDDENVYLIADDFVNRNWIPNSSNHSIDIVKEGNDYQVNYNGVSNDYTGAANIVGNQLMKQKYNQWIYSNPNSTQKNAKVSAYLLDTNIWTNKIGNNYAKFAIGAPTIEMFADSYNKNHNITIQYDSTGNKGYKVKLSNQSEMGILSNAIETDSLYIKENTNVYGMWLASPSQQSENVMMRAFKTGKLGYTTGRTTVDLGLRPLICLKSSTKFTDYNRDQVYELK